jgi:hypothetical protein
MFAVSLKQIVVEFHSRTKRFSSYAEVFLSATIFFVQEGYHVAILRGFRPLSFLERWASVFKSYFYTDLWKGKPSRIEGWGGKRSTTIFYLEEV